MKIINLRISNFRAIQRAEIENAGTAVVIAGPNGSGKSCILDAIRLFKSAYGSYQQSELDLWSNEFQLNWRSESGDLKALLRDKNSQMTIEGEIEISEREKDFLTGDGHWMIRELVWKELYPQVATHQGRIRGIASQRILEMDREVQRRTTDRRQRLEDELSWKRAKGIVQIAPNGDAIRGDSLALQLIFGFFIPEKMGIIDYHGSHRKYEREQLRTIALQESDEEEKIKSAALYNYESKYANLKSAMAGEYVRELIERDAHGKQTGKSKPLSKTLQDLFKLFLPSKTFKGPVAVAGGDVAFPVWVDEDTQHDINELSSGEKEILFAYLRARTLSPRQSVLLIDEPELHLNPGLVQGLPQFYEQHIGRDLENQIWLVTHSDRFLRDALDTTGMAVYHMQQVGEASGSNQLRLIESKSGIEGLLIDLVGELAAYRPDGKVVFLESEDSQFDLKMVTRLFPEDATSINFLTGGNKANVRRLQETIEAMAEHGQAEAEVFSIVDPDYEIWNRMPRDKGNRLEWTVYHIENYLLDPTFVLEALGVVNVEGAGRMSETRVEQLLERAAEELVDVLAVKMVREDLWRRLRRAINIDLDQDLCASRQLAEGIAGAAREVQQVGAECGNEESTRKLLDHAKDRFRLMWSDGEWKTKFPGREILRKLCGVLGSNLEYGVLRNAIVGEMAKAGHRPKGMRQVIGRIRSH